MPAITKTRLTAAMDTAKSSVISEMKDSYWANVTEMVCKLYAKKLMEVLEEKE